MSSVLNYNDIVDILSGAAFLGGGGGGPLDIALNMLEKHKNSTVKLFDVNEMKDGDVAVVIAAMGNPLEAAGKDFDRILKDTFGNMHDTDQRINCILPGECGGFNTFAPIYLALQDSSIHLIDADGAGRAVPGLDTSLASVGGISITPFNVTSEHGDFVMITTKADQEMNEAQKCELIARGVAESSCFGDVGGIAGWKMDKVNLQSAAVCGGISRCLTLGRTIRQYKTESQEVRRNSIFTYLNEKMSESIFCKTVSAEVYIEELKEAGEVEGFAAGRLELSDRQPFRYQGRIDFLNEFLVSSILSRKPVAHGNMNRYIVDTTAPTIITLFDEENFISLTDSLLKRYTGEYSGTRLSLGYVSVRDTWGKVETSKVEDAWKKYLEETDYDGGCNIF